MKNDLVRYNQIKIIIQWEKVTKKQNVEKLSKEAMVFEGLKQKTKRLSGQKLVLCLAWFPLYCIDILLN